MKSIWRIAKVELQTLFYSPIAWVVLIVMGFQSGLELTDGLQQLRDGFMFNSSFFGLTGVIIGKGLFGRFSENLFLYMPLLTMGLISKEYNSGSVKLLLSSPISIAQIVAGKYLSMLIYAACMVAILAITCVAGYLSITSADYKLILSGLLGIYLVISAFSAIGLFLSACTSYQLVAAFTTFVVLGLIRVMGGLGIGGIMHFLSFQNRADEFYSGLIDTGNIFSFLLVIFLFLGFTLIYLQARQSSRSGWNSLSKYATLALVVWAADYVTHWHSIDQSWDVTEAKENSLTPYSDSIAKQLSGPWQVHAYDNILDGAFQEGLTPKRLNDYKLFQEYQRFLNNTIDFDYTFYYDTCDNPGLFAQNRRFTKKDLAQNIAEYNNIDFDELLTPEEIRKHVDLSYEGNRFVREIEIGGKKTILREFYDQQHIPGEMEITTALRKLLVKPMKTGFLAANNERGIRSEDDPDYTDRLTAGYGRSLLINRGFDFSEIKSLSGGIPIDVDLLVIADPGKPYDAVELAKIREYIGRGGNVLITAEPAHKSLVQPIVEALGIHFMNGILLQDEEEYAPDMTRADVPDEIAGFSEKFSKLVADTGTNVITYGVMGMTCDSDTTFKVSPLLVSHRKEYWNHPGLVKADSAKYRYNPGDGDEKKTIPIAIALRREINNKEQKIVVIGDADLFSNGSFSDLPKKNAEFVTSLFSWYDNGVYPIPLTWRDFSDKKVSASLGQLRLLRIIFLGFLPFFILVSGAVLLIRRGRR